MTNRQENKLSMYQRTLLLLEEKGAAISSLPKYSDYKGELVTAVNLIVVNTTKQIEDTTGYRQSKEELASTVELLASKTAKKVIGYANSVQDNQLYTMMKASEATLRRRADNILISIAQGIYDKAEEKKTELAPYGLTEAMQTELLEAIEAFNAILAKPKRSIEERKAITEEIARNFKAADKACKDLDTLAEIVRFDNLTFYSEYRSARNIIESGTGSLALRCKAIDAATRVPLMSVNVKIEQNPGQVFPIGTPVFEPLNKKTNADGTFVLKSLPQGEYVATVEYPSYVTMQHTFSKYDGMVCELELVLEKKQAS